MAAETAIGTELTVDGGVFRVAANEEKVFALVIANMSAAPKAANGIRVQIRLVNAYTKPTPAA